MAYELNDYLSNARVASGDSTSFKLRAPARREQLPQRPPFPSNISTGKNSIRLPKLPAPTLSSDPAELTSTLPAPLPDMSEYCTDLSNEIPDEVPSASEADMTDLSAPIHLVGQPFEGLPVEGLNADNQASASFVGQPFSYSLSQATSHSVSQPTPHLFGSPSNMTSAVNPAVSSAQDLAAVTAVATVAAFAIQPNIHSVQFVAPVQAIHAAPASVRLQRNHFTKDMLSPFPRLMGAFDRYLSQAFWEERGEGALVVVPTTFHVQRVRELEADLSTLLRKVVVGIEARRPESVKSETPIAPVLPRPQISMPFARAAAPVDLIEEERKKRNPAPTLIHSPAYSVCTELTKRWAEGVNRGQRDQALWVHGDSGTGKTALIQQLNEWVDLKNRMVSTNVIRFLYEWRKSMEDKDNLNFVRKYRREVDVFVLENIDELSGKIKTQQEVLFTVNAILDHGGSVVVSSAAHPLKLKEFLEPALYSRLFSGLILEMPRPDRQFKENSWRKLVQDYGLTDCQVDVHLEHQLLNIPVDCARKVNALFINAIGRFSLKRSLCAQDICELESLHGSRPAFGGFADGNRGRRYRTPSEVIDEVARLCGVTRAAVLGKVRRSDIIIARRFVSLALARFSGLTNNSIANVLEKDPSTISHALKTIEDDLEKNRHIAEQWNWICEQLGAPANTSKND